MKSSVTATILGAAMCSAILATARPAAADDAKPMHHHHHMMHGKHGMMKKSSGDAETEKLNEQSLQNAKGNATPASSTTPASGAMMPSSSGMMTPPSGGAMTAPGTGMTPPSSGSMGSAMPSNAPPITTPPPAPTPK